MTKDIRPGSKILIVDDEWQSDVMTAVQRRFVKENWESHVVKIEQNWSTGEEFETAALFAIEEEEPDAVLLDVRFGEHRDDQFKGLEILHKIVQRHPALPVLMFTQYVQGPNRETTAAATLAQGARVDFVDKLASADEVVLRLRRLIGTTPDTIQVGSNITLDLALKQVFVTRGAEQNPIDQIQHMRFEVLQELVKAWYRRPGELVPYSRLERTFEGENARASLRVRIREIKDAVGKALGVPLGPDDFIINIKERGYRLAVLKDE
jgi:DNA-binding response OmpR family regulator